MKLTYNVKPTVPAVFNSNTALTIAENRDKFQALEDALFSLPQLADEDYDLVEYKSGLSVSPIWKHQKFTLRYFDIISAKLKDRRFLCLS